MYVKTKQIMLNIIVINIIIIISSSTILLLLLLLYTCIDLKAVRSELDNGTGSQVKLESNLTLRLNDGDS